MLYAQNDDPYQWLEEVDGEKAIAFVKEQNAKTKARLEAEPMYKTLYNKSLEIRNSTDRIVYGSIYGDYMYNFWQDKTNPRGIWRRATRTSYLAGKPEWDVLLDFDKMAEKDNVKWVYKGAEGLYPDYNRFLIRISKGGGDASITREFDVNKKEFIADGFQLDESKGSVSYIDANTVLVGTNFGEGTMTTSGYPRQVKIWKRGTPLSSAELVYEGQKEDVGIWGFVMRDGDKTYTGVSRSMTFFSSETYIMVNGKMQKLNIPDDSNINGLLNNQLIVKLKSDFSPNEESFKSGALVSFDFAELLKGRFITMNIIAPDERTSISEVANTKNKLLVNVMTNVKNELYIYTYKPKGWTRVKVNAPDFGSLYIGSTDEKSDLYFFNFQNFLTPPSLYVADAGKNTTSVLKSLPAYFDGSKYKVEQLQAKSTDGTMIPYFVVSSKTAVNNGNNPTLLYAYGGFEASMQPYYSGVMGNCWLENGGVYVLANIRGGGEFGPKWHQDGLKEKRQIVYDDFHAVAQDLITRNITSAKHLGIMGGSNGGLLMGVAFTQRPDLYNAVVCQVPLLDMKRYSHLLAGASWMGEYGDPDKPEEWAYISKYSPYQNLKKDAKYPEVFFYTSTRDDRVHPGHARKMAAKMIDMGYPVLYYENMEGGHAGSSTNEQRAEADARDYSYLFMKLK
jgi:prolyl oligopeptidase